MRIRVDNIKDSTGHKYIIDSIGIKNKIINSIKTKYKISPSRKFIDSMNTVSAFYAENLKEKKNAKMQSRPTEIAIDKYFFKFDRYGNIIDLDPNQFQIIESQIGHEFLHNASRNDGYCGIWNKNNNYYTALNEGLTQMFTEDIFDYSVSKFSDGYTDYKKIAKMLKATFNIGPLYNSYFNHTDDLRNECNKLSSNKDFFESLNRKLNVVYQIRKIARKNGNVNRELDRIYNIYMGNVYEYLLVNIVIPKLMTLNDFAKKTYLTSILHVVSNDYEVTNKIKSTLSKYIGMNNDELKIEKKRLTDGFILKDEQINLLFKMNNQEDISKSIYSFKDGKIRLSNGREINNREILSRVYQFLGEKSYIFTDEYTDDCEKILYRGKNLIMWKDDILERRKLFECIKKRLLDRGILVLNDFRELDNSKELVDTSFVKLRKNNVISFEDLKKVCLKFNVTMSQNKNDNRMKVTDRKTGKTITNQRLIDLANFANLWLHSTSPSEKKDFNARMKIAFSNDNEKIYNAILSTIISQYQKTGNLGVELLVRLSDKKISDAAKNLFSNPMKYEFAYSFLNSQIENNILQAEKEKSLKEMLDEKYTEKYVQSEVKSILAH